MQRVPAVTNDSGGRDPNPNRLVSSSTREGGGGFVGEDAADQLEELGLYLAHERKLEKDDMRRRGRRAKWTASRRRHVREG